MAAHRKPPTAPPSRPITCLCFAQLERVLVRFRLHELQRGGQRRPCGLRAPLLDELVHPSAASCTGLETPVTDSQLRLPPGEARAEALSMRVVDISGGGLAVVVPTTAVFGLQRRYPQLSLPDGPDLDIELVVRNLPPQRQPNGTSRSSAWNAL